MPTIKEIIAAIEEQFPPRYQEDFDNTGLQVGTVDRDCSGVVVCVDVTPEIIDEAVAKGCNLILSHHPLIFKGLKRISNDNRVDTAVCRAIRNEVAIYSCHTAVDNTPRLGVSWKMGEMLGLTDVEAIESRGPEAIGSGIVGNLPRPMTPAELVALVKSTFDSPIARCSDPEAVAEPIVRVGLCGGAGSFLIPEAMAKGATAFITSDSKFNLFLDHVGRLFLVDIGHFESEQCTKSIFYRAIQKKFPNFAPLYLSELEKNPITYL